MDGQSLSRRSRHVFCWVTLIGISVSATAAESVSVSSGTESQDGSTALPAEQTTVAVQNGNSVQLDEIVVTAQKRSENIQDVPISIQAFRGGALAASGITNTRDLDQLVPSLQFASIASFPLIFIRGLGSDNFVPSADPSIATYIDGIYVVNGAATVQSLANIERVEVLKGPQGTLFGRNATGGAISVTTIEPGSDVEGSLDGQLGNFDARSIKGSVSGPITSWLSASLSGEDSFKDAYYTAINFKTQPDRLGAARLKFFLHPTKNLSLSLTGFHSGQSGLFFNIYNNIDPSLLGKALFIQPQEDNYVGKTDFPASTNATQDIGYGILNWKLPWFDIKLLGSDQRQTADGNLDYDGSPIPLAALTTSNVFSKLQTGELQLLSNDSSWGAQKFKWISGLYYLRSTAGISGYIRLAPGLVSGLLALPQQPVLTQLGQRLGDIFGAFGLQQTPLGDGGLSLLVRGALGTESYSAYAQGTYAFTDWADLTLGGRIQHERRFLTEAETDLSDFSGTGAITLLPFKLQSTSASNFAPKAVLSLRPFRHALVYLSYSVAYKSGTYNIVNVYKPPNYIVPERVSSFEFGTKLVLAKGLLRLNAAVFDSEIRNLQSGFTSFLSGGVVQFFSVPHARSRGAEINLGVVPLPTLDRGLALDFNAAYIDAIYTDFPNGPGYQEGTGLYSGNMNHSGNHLTHTPKISGNIGVVQTLYSANGRYELAIADHYNSSIFSTAQNTTKQSAYAVLNARMAYLHTPWNLKITLFCENLLDRRFHSLVGPTDFGVESTLAPPREYGVQVNWEY